jgi:hypothetical protein
LQYFGGNLSIDLGEQFSRPSSQTIAPLFVSATVISILNLPRVLVFFRDKVFQQ